MVIPADVLGFAVVMATLMGTALCVKFLVWGKAPTRKLRGGAGERLAELEDRVERLSEVMREQSRLIEDVHERLDFTERVLSHPANVNAVAKLKELGAK